MKELTYYHVNMKNITTGEVYEKDFYYKNKKEHMFNKVLSWTKYIKSFASNDDDFVVEIEDVIIL